MWNKLTLILNTLLLFTALALNAQTLQNQFSSTPYLDTVIEQYDLFVDQKLAELTAPGAAIAIVKGDSTLYMKCFGVRKVGQPEPIDSHTVFRIASLSKGFAAVLAGLLVQDRLLHWDDKVTRYLPNFSLKNSSHAQNLTIRHILNHTSGLPSHTYDNLVEANIPFDMIIEQLKGAPVVWPLGKNYNYQNVIYSLIGKIVQATTGRTYDELIKTRLFTPLGMKDASLDYATLVASSNLAAPHIRRRQRWVSTPINNSYYAVAPAAGINASINDMAQWLKALLGHRSQIVSPGVIQDISQPAIKTRRELRRYYWNGNVRHAYYGLGWRILDYSGVKIVFHAGGLKGYVAQIAFVPEHNLGIVVLLNSSIENIFVSTFFDMYFAAGASALGHAAQ